MADAHPSQDSPGLAILVNTSDGFDDCWPPFFRLLEIYAPTWLNLPIHLNTERKNWQWDSATNLRCTKSWAADDEIRPSWSQCLIRALDKISEDHVLYLQEDYFLRSAVRQDVIEQAVALLKKKPALGVVNLNAHGPQFQNHTPIDNTPFVTVHSPVRYKVSTQAAIWRKDYLRSLLYPWEHGWAFEKFSSWRANFSDVQHASVAPEIMRKSPVVDYVFTGVMKGKWHMDCVPLFASHGLPVNFQHRGFYQQKGRLKSKLEVLNLLIKDPRTTLRSLQTLWQVAKLKS